MTTADWLDSGTTMNYLEWVQAGGVYDPAHCLTGSAGSSTEILYTTAPDPLAQTQAIGYANPTQWMESIAEEYPSLLSRFWNYPVTMFGGTYPLGTHLLSGLVGALLAVILIMASIVTGPGYLQWW